MFFSCNYPFNITKNHTLSSSATFSSCSFVRVTKKTLCNSSFRRLSFGHSIQSTSEIVEIFFMYNCILGTKPNGYICPMFANQYKKIFSIFAFFSTLILLQRNHQTMFYKYVYTWAFSG